jgi:hypothetical protein
MSGVTILAKKCPLCQSALVVVGLGYLVCAEHGRIFSNEFTESFAPIEMAYAENLHGPDPESVANALDNRPMRGITTTGPAVPRFVNGTSQFFPEENNDSQIWASVQATRNSSFLLVVNGAHP